MLCGESDEAERFSPLSLSRERALRLKREDNRERDGESEREYPMALLSAVIPRIVFTLHSIPRQQSAHTFASSLGEHATNPLAHPPPPSLPFASARFTLSKGSASERDFFSSVSPCSFLRRRLNNLSFHPSVLQPSATLRLHRLASKNK